MVFEEQEISFTFKQFFVPLTTKKAIIIIAVIGFIVFSNSLFNGFVWDDVDYILNNPQVHQLSLPDIFDSNIFNTGLFYRPLQAMFFTSMYLLFGHQAFFYHLVQLTLHIIDTCLLFMFFCLFFTEGISLFLALVFLVHPINVESVAWISASVNEVCFFFGITALLLVHKQSLSLP